MREKLLFLLASCVASAQPPLPDIEYELIDQSVGGIDYRSLQFNTVKGYFYKVEQSLDLKSWDEVMSFDALGADVNVPMFQLGGGTPPPGNGASGSQSTVMLNLTGTTNGGTLVSWRSLSTNSAVQAYLPTVNVDTSWNTAPITNFLTLDYQMMIFKEAQLTTLQSTNFPDLSVPDQILLDEFVANYSDIANGDVGNSPAVPLVGTVSKFFRVSVAIADIDRDGIPDLLEETAPPLGSGTNRWNPDTDGDGYWDGAEAAQNTDPNDPQDHPNPSTAPGNVASSGGGGGGPLVSVLDVIPIEVGFHQNHVLESDNGKTRPCGQNT